MIPWLLVALALAPAEEPCDRSWSAQVVEAGTDERIPEARVVVRVAGREPLVLRTDDRGEVELAGLCPGTLALRVDKPEHVAGDLEVELGPGETQTVIELEALHGHHSERVIVIHDEGSESVGASESLSGAELARVRGQGLAATIDGMAGVSTLRGSAGGLGKPIIRGQFGRRNLVIVDGIRHEGQEWGLDHAPEVDPQTADRITVIKGAGTTRFGPEASGGVVLLEPRPLPRQPGLSGEVGTFGFSNPLGGGLSARLDLMPARSRGLALRLEGNLARHRAALTPEYALDNTGAYTWNVGARLGRAGERVDVELGYHLMRQRLGICRCLRVTSAEDFQRTIDRGEPVDVDLYRADFQIERPKQEIWHHLVFARARISLAAAGELHLAYGFQYNDRREFDVVRDSVTGPQLRLDLATHNGDLRYEHAAAHLRAWTLVGTLGAALGQQNNAFTAATTLVPDYDQWSWSLYDIERFVHERVEIELGARYDGLHRVARLEERDWLGQQAGGRLDADDCAADGSGGGRCVVDFNTASATLGMLARPFRRLREASVHLQLDTSARTPAIDEQFMNGAAPSFPLLGVGDSRLGIERSVGGELAARYDGDWLQIEANAYGSFIDDYIYFVPEQQEGQCAPLTCTTRGPMPVFVFEAIDALLGGGELRVDLRAPRLPFGLSGNAAWVRGRDLVAADHLALLPADRYSLTGRYFLPDTRVSARAYLELGGTVVARQTRYQVDLDFAPPPPAYVLLGAGAGVEFLAGGQILRLSAAGTNLLNMRYRDYNSLLRYFADEPGWGLQLRFAVDFDVALEREA